MGYGVGDGGLEGDAAGVEAGEVYADELAWLEGGVHFLLRAASTARTFSKCGLQVQPAPEKILALWVGKCKAATVR